MEIKREEKMMNASRGEEQAAALLVMDERGEVQSKARTMNHSPVRGQLVMQLTIAQPNTPIKKETAGDETFFVNTRATLHPRATNRSCELAQAENTEDEVYVSQEEAIVKIAREYGTDMRMLNKYFDDKIEEVAREFPGSEKGWQLGWTEYLLWERFFPRVPFPGRLLGNGRRGGLALESSRDAIQSGDTNLLSNGGEGSGLIPESPRVFKTREAPRQPFEVGKRSVNMLSNGDRGGLVFEPLKAITPKEAPSRQPSAIVGITGVGRLCSDDLISVSATTEVQEPSCRSLYSDGIVAPTSTLNSVSRFYQPPTSHSSNLRTSDRRNGARVTVNSLASSYNRGNGRDLQYIDGKSELNGKVTSHHISGGTNGHVNEVGVKGRTRGDTSTNAKPEITLAQYLRIQRESRVAILKEYSGGNYANSWLLWKEQSMIWDYFFDGQIPSKEPSRFVQARTSAPHEVDIRKSPGVGKPHITLESYMEAKAKQLGGAPFRKIFFKYLGWARAQVNILYPCCGSQMRSYLSDYIAWDQFYFKEPFPRKRPQCQSNCKIKHSISVMRHQLTESSPNSNHILVHSAMQAQISQQHINANSSIKAIPTCPPVPVIQLQSGYKLVDQAPLGRRFEFGATQKEPDNIASALKLERSLSRMPEANISLSPLAIRLPDRSLTSRNRAIIVFNKSYTQCTIQEANLVRASFGQDKEGNNEVGKALGSKFIYSSSGNTTYLLVAPSVDDIASSPSTHQDWDTVLKHGARFIEAWVIRIIMTKTLRSLFSYWEECPDFKPNDNLPAAYLILQDKLIPCLMSGLKNITYVMATDEDLELVERVLRCHIHIHQGSKESGLRLSAVPFDNGNDKSIEVATSFLLDWATIALKGELLRLSVHFRVYCQKNGLSGLIVQLEYAKTSAAGDILNGSGSAKNQWRAYAGTFRLSDLDRMVIEGKVKSEGLMRMVFDCKRDEMVSLEEFRRRTQKRYLAIASGVLKGVERGPAPSSSALAPSSSINENMIDLEEGEIRTEKRKHTAPDEVDMSSKRAKLTHHGTISSP